MKAIPAFAYDVDAMRIGTCSDTDTNLTECSGGFCNDMEIGGVCQDDTVNYCSVGEPAGLKIECKGNKGTQSSCQRGSLMGVEVCNIENTVC